MLRGAGFRLDVIYPADDPHTALLSIGGKPVRLTSRPGEAPDVAKFDPQFLLTRASADGGEGRAGMIYRDLIPGRLGGCYVASHITIPQGGPVADWVHFHRVGFQMIYVRAGWVRVVYEDQGEPFVMNPGDMVLQPPEIRHRVLESSAGLEVVEIGCPALHETVADHAMELPNGPVAPDRTFAGQTFLRHVASETPWQPFGDWEAQESGMKRATGGIAEVRTLRAAGNPAIAFPPHLGELMFGFVLDGSAELECLEVSMLGPADAFVIPPGSAWTLRNASPDFRLLQIATAAT